MECKQKSYICRTEKDVEYIIHKHNIDTYNYNLPAIISVNLNAVSRPYNWCFLDTYGSERCDVCAIACKNLIDIAKLRELKLERILNEHQ